MQFICPPKLQKKFMIAFWTVPEGLAIVTLLILFMYINTQLLFIPVLACVLTARVDLEHNFINAFAKRVLYYYSAKTYRIMPPVEK